MRLTTVCMIVDNNGKNLPNTTIGTVTKAGLSKLTPRKQYEKISSKCLENLKNLKTQLKHIADLGTGYNSFRISSRLLPMFDESTYSKLYDETLLKKIDIGLSQCKKIIDSSNIRVSMHPDKFTVINSKTTASNIKGIKNLEYHIYIMKRLTTPEIGCINIHINGTDNDLCNEVKNRKDIFEWLTLENDDIIERANTINTLNICEKYNIRMVFDIHHHFCQTRELLDIDSELMNRIIATWNKTEPLFHISQSLNELNESSTNKTLSQHSDYITDIDLINYTKNLFIKYPTLTLDVEAKCKNHSVTDLMQKLK